MVILHFPRLSWQVKAFNSNTGDGNERNYNLKLNNTQVVTEKAYDKLKSRWRILYQKTELKIYNLKYVIMACVMLNHFCIHTNDPCNTRWKLSLEEVELNVGKINRQQNNRISNENATKIAKWLWQHSWTFSKQTTCSVKIFLKFYSCCGITQ